MASSAAAQGHIFIGPGLSPFKRTVTILGVLGIISPIPFTNELEEKALVKRNKKGEVIEIRWEDLTRVKEEFFPNGKRIGVIAYRKPATPEQKAKAWAVYRDEVTDIDGLAEALKQT